MPDYQRPPWLSASCIYAVVAAAAARAAAPRARLGDGVYAASGQVLVGHARRVAAAPLAAAAIIAGRNRIAVFCAAQQCD